MINWVQLTFNFIWVLGLAIILSTLSYHHWWAQTHGQRLWAQISQPNFQIGLWFGLTLSSIGFAGISTAVWEIIVWIILAMGSAYFTVDAWRTSSPQL